jgi:cysteine-rich repeat protein
VCDSVAPGHIAPEADVVLGQPDCTTNVRGDVGRPLNQFCYPLDVAFDRLTRTLYVADAGDDRIESRILKFTPDRQTGDFIGGSSGVRLRLQLPSGYPGTPPQLCYKRPIEITLDTQSRGLWVRHDSDVCVELVDVRTGRPSHTVPQFGGPIRGIDVDELGNLFVTDAWYGLIRLQRQTAGMGQPEDVFVGSPFSADSLFTATGVAVLSDPAGVGPDQLVVSDGHRMLTWNNYDLATLRSGQGADDVYGAADFNDGSNLSQQFFYYPQAYGGRLWTEKGRQGELLAFDYPLCGSKWQQSGIGCTQPSTPSQSIPVGPVNGFTGHPLLGSPNTKVLASPPDAGDLDFTLTSAGDAVWVADRWNSRVFRIANLNGSGAPYVDVILGQADASGTQCHRGLTNPGADTLCIPYDVAIDPAGNLYVGDNGGEVGTDRRVLEFDAVSLVTDGTPLFGVPASRVYGTGGDFTVTGWTSTRDPGISPFKPILHPRGPMVVLNNAYTSQRFPVMYLNPLYDTLPQLILGDFTSIPSGSGFIDRHGNLYAPDYTWSRVLIYKTPFVKLLGCGGGTLDPDEECDDGNSDPSDGCTNVCTACGNGAVGAGEDCDDGNLVDGDGCSKSCAREGPVCGNGVVQAGEECDDGNGDPSDGCTNVCTACGNGIVGPGEQCDDGNLTDRDGCSSSCLHETPLCGNGVVEAAEECDDGDSDPSNGCTNACATCGNGVVSAGEQCDDGSLVAGDGCATDCTYELIPGNGAGSVPADRRACQLEWALLSNGPQATDDRGRPSSTQSCRDNDPSCDFDSVAGVCEFRVVACLNNVDPNLPTCPPVGVGEVRVRESYALRDPENYNGFLTALADLRNPVAGIAGLTLPLGPAQTDLCTAPFPARVGLGAPTYGRVVFRASSFAAIPPRRPRRDTDALTLLCTP